MNGNNKRHSETPGRDRRNSPALQAIEVEDDEVGEFDDTSDDMYDQADGDHDYDANDTFSEGSDNSDIEQIFPQIMGALKKSGKDRYQSVSEDSDEDDIKVLSGDEEEETRYSIKQQKSKPKPKSKPNPGSGTNETDSEEEGEILDEAPTNKVKATDGLTKKEKRDRKASRKAFWAAKGVPEAEDDEDEEEVKLGVVAE